MDTALLQKIPFTSLDRNLAKTNCTENLVCASCDTEVVDFNIKLIIYLISELLLIRSFNFSR